MLTNSFSRRNKVVSRRTQLKTMAEDLSVACNAEVALIFYPYPDDRPFVSPQFVGFPSFHAVVERAEGPTRGNGLQDLTNALSNFNLNHFSAQQKLHLRMALLRFEDELRARIPAQGPQNQIPAQDPQNQIPAQDP